jgi:hypothetical protein
MKIKTLTTMASLLAFILLIDGCALFEDTDDGCLKNNWEIAQEPIIYVRMTSNLVTFYDGMTQYNLTQASSRTMRTEWR